MILVALPAYIILLDGGEVSGEDAAELGFVFDFKQVIIKKNTTEGGGLWYGNPNPEFFLRGGWRELAMCTDILVVFEGGGESDQLQAEYVDGFFQLAGIGMQLDQQRTVIDRRG